MLHKHILKDGMNFKCKAKKCFTFINIYIEDYAFESVFSSIWTHTRWSFLWTSCDSITLLLRAASSNNRRLRWMWAYVPEQVCVWVAVLLLAAGFEVSGSLRALVCLIAFLSHWSAVARVAAILLQRLQWNCERQGLQSVTPRLSIKVTLPGNPVAWQPSHRERKSISPQNLCLSVSFLHLTLRAVRSFLDVIVVKSLQSLSVNIHVSYFYSRNLSGSQSKL